MWKYRINAFYCQQLCVRQTNAAVNAGTGRHECHGSRSHQESTVDPVSSQGSAEHPAELSPPGRDRQTSQGGGQGDGRRYPRFYLTLVDQYIYYQASRYNEMVGFLSNTD